MHLFGSVKRKFVFQKKKFRLLMVLHRNSLFRSMTGSFPIFDKFLFTFLIKNKHSKENQQRQTFTNKHILQNNLTNTASKYFFLSQN